MEGFCYPSDRLRKVLPEELEDLAPKIFHPLTFGSGGFHGRLTLAKDLPQAMGQLERVPGNFLEGGQEFAGRFLG